MIKHKFVSGRPTPVNPLLIGGPKWDEEHDVSVDIRVADPTGIANVDTALLQSALDSGGSVRVTALGTYLINGTLKIKSGTDLYVGAGTVVRRADNTNLPMMMNSALDTHIAGGRTTVTISWTAGQIATVSWTAHGLTRENYVWIEGASISLYNNVFRIVSVVDANSFKIILPKMATAAPTGTITALKCDTEISIRGPGLWDGNNVNNNAGDSYNRDIFVIVGLGKSEIDGCRFKDYHRAITSGALSDVRIGSLKYTCGTNPADSHKTYGPVNGLVLEHLGADSNDDGISIQTKEPPAFQWANGKQPFGDIRGISVEHSRFRSFGAPGHGLVFYVSDGLTIDNLFVEDVDVFGEQVAGVMLKNGDTFTSGTFGVATFRKVRGGIGTPSAGFGMVINAAFDAIDIDTIEPIPGNLTNTGPFRVSALAPGKKLTIRNLRADVSSWPSSNSNFFSILGNVDEVDLTDWYVVENSAQANLIQISGCTVKLLKLRNSHITGVLRGIQITSGGVVDTLLIEGCYVKNAFSFVDIVNATNPLKAVVNSNEFDTVTRIFRPATGTGKVLEIHSNGGNKLISSAWVAAAAPATWETYTWEITGDPIALTSTGQLAATVGQRITSTQAGAEGGPAILTPAGWVALGTGSAGVNTVIA
jgi:hypothetical protein